MRARVLGVVAFLSACGGSEQPPSDASVLRSELATITLKRDLDLLFVIDDTSSMAAKQDNLAASFPSFLAALDALDGEFPNLHLGVVTTDMGTKGTQVATPGPIVGTVGDGGCAGTGKGGVLQTGGAPISDSFLSDVRQPDGSRLKNYTGDLATVFSQMVKVGVTGCSFAQPLHAMQRALDGTNPGFLRLDALLGVVFLTDEDDCTIKDPAMLAPESVALGPLTPFRCTRFGVTCVVGGQTSDAMNTVGVKDGCHPSTGSPLMDDTLPFADFLHGLKSDRTKVMVGGIWAPSEPFRIELDGQMRPSSAPSCAFQGASGLELAYPPTRLKAFIDKLVNRATFTTICQNDLSSGLQHIAELIARRIGSACLRELPADVDPMTPGLQEDCIVEDVLGGPNGDATKIPKCSAPEAPPCWRLDTDAASCVNVPKLVVVRDTAPDPETITRMTCVIPG